MAEAKGALGTRKELTLRIDADLYEQLREVTYKMRISKQRALMDALEMWLARIGSERK